MKLKIIAAVFFWAALLMMSCNRDEISFEAPSQELRFSADTVFCDTVYHQVRSESYAVKVYNTEDRDIMIPNIELGRGASSLYRINVDGKSGYSFNNVPLRKKDSLYIFVEIAPTASSPEAIAEDRIFFTTPAGKQHVTLFSVVQDAEFFVETAGNPNILSGNITWNDGRAKIIYGDLTVAPGSTLNIEQGTKVYFFRNSGMKVAGGATVNINGDLDDEVIIRGDRNDPKYDTIPKNWNSMRFEPGSTVNMNYARVFGGIRGLDLREAAATIKNSIIHTFDEYGIYAVNSTVNAENLVMNNCQNADFGIFKGGNYNIIHSTLANYWQLTGTGSGLAMYAANEWINSSGQTETAPLSLNIGNSILYTKSANALQLKPVSGQTFNYQVRNSLLKYDVGAGFNFDTSPGIINSFKNTDPAFLNYYTEKMNLRVAADSYAKGKGSAGIAATVPLDIVKISRTSNPTLGAYQ
ncbi:hypothetical protein [Chryseobacterium sp.]|uniref:hypothetical protein n=1 Tax=Chryseobacterium sp. TaxID=1871047 RepID=UPI0012A8C378|nr:hypothetical protein [Chryseobacterium sp.]QFG54116.1 hypothetical protein F7R58_11355 [Chryseobacterium sp.]